MPWSIIMLTMNKRGMAIASLSSVLRVRSQDDEIIVVDNRSSDGLAEWLRTRNDLVPIIGDVDLTVPQARNLGISRASNDDILFLDSDIDLKPHSLTKMAEALSDPVVGMVGDAAGIFIPEWIRNDTWGHDLPDGNYPGTNFIVGYCMGMRRDTIDLVGPFDEGFPRFYWEDVDYGVRVRKAGRSLVVVSEICYHHGHSTVSARWTRREISEVEKAGMARMLKKHEHDCPVWALVIANDASEEDISTLHRSLNEEHPNTILHVVSDVRSLPPWRLCFDGQWYPDHLYRRRCVFSAGRWVCSDPVVPQRDDGLAALTSPIDRRRF